MLAGASIRRVNPNDWNASSGDVAGLDDLESRMRLAVIELRRRAGTERLYAFAIYPSHEDEYRYVLDSSRP
jgi:hypothetical protein